MYNVPSRRRKGKKSLDKPNIVPILDAVFIFLFFLLMSSSFFKMFEIPSDVPIISTKKPPKKKEKPLALTLRIEKRKMRLYTGVPSRLNKTIRNLADGSYNLEELHNHLIGLKRAHPKEKDIIFEPVSNIPYEQLVKIMDSVRILRNTDESIYQKDQDGIDVKINFLFTEIIFGNIQS